MNDKTKVAELFFFHARAAVDEYQRDVKSTISGSVNITYVDGRFEASLAKSTENDLLTASQRMYDALVDAAADRDEALEKINEGTLND